MAVYSMQHRFLRVRESWCDLTGHSVWWSSRFYQTNNYFTRPNTCILWHVIDYENCGSQMKRIKKKWVIKTDLINDLRFCMSFCTKYGCYDRFFHQTTTFSISVCILEPKFCWSFGLVIFNFLLTAQILSGPTGFGKDWFYAVIVIIA